MAMCPLFGCFLALASRYAVISKPNMNGLYEIQNPRLDDKWAQFNTNFSSYPAIGDENNTVRYLEAYSDEISTQYSQVWWTMGGLYNFSTEVQREFDGEVMAIVGYEFDQVIQNQDGTEQPVPVTWSYNHHYSARVVGKHAEMYRVPVDGHKDPQAKNAGHLSGPYGGKSFSLWKARSNGDPSPDSWMPIIIDFDEANGGEWRKSFHGYPHGYAQLIESPIGFRIEPMQIDTKNRDKMKKPADGFVPDPTLVPKSYAAPLTGPDAVYSGLLECPCTDRISKVIEGQYRLQADEHAKNYTRQIATYTECYTASDKVGLPLSKNKTKKQGSDKLYPPGCSITIDEATNKQEIFFNHLEVAAPCGTTNNSTETKGKIVGSSKSLVSLELELDPNQSGGKVKISVQGPAAVWFGIAFGATEMKDQPYAIIVDGHGMVSEFKLGDHVAGTRISTQVEVISNNVKNNTRTIVLTRSFVGRTADHFNFTANGDDNVIEWMNAIGSTADYSMHQAMSSASITLVKVGVRNCLLGEAVTFGHTHGAFVYTHDDNTTETIWTKGGSCSNTTSSDLIPGEYDVTKQTPAKSRKDVNASGIQTNIFKFSVREMINPGDTRTQVFSTPHPSANQTGIKLLYINGHCHAAACIQFDLYNDDTGELICRQQGRFGKTLRPDANKSGDRFDERGYITLRPSFNTTLRSEKITNATFTHYGEM
eukprot:UC4_evm5s127